MDKLRIGINGFGRIGRMALRASLAHPEVEIAGINDLCPADYLAYMLRFDTVHGAFPREVSSDASHIVVGRDAIPVFSAREPGEIPWKSVGADVVLECTGRFLTAERARGHLDAGAGRVIMSAPPKDDTPMLVVGVNDGMYRGERIVSNASCTTNCLAPLAKVINDRFGIESGLMTTVHAVTATQNTVDGVSLKDWRGGRAAFGNIIPSSTGAARAVGRVIPELAGRLTGMSMRVPTLDVSAVDLTVNLRRGADYEEICRAVEEAAAGEMRGILGVTDECAVSSDFVGDTRSCIFDRRAGIALTDKFVKLIAWYDNEAGYAARLVDLALKVSKSVEK